MKANTTSMMSGSQVIAYVVITGFTAPIILNYPSHVVAVVR